MTSALLILAALITLGNICIALYVSVIAGTIVYSWWKNLQVTKDTLPPLLQEAINKLAARYIEPYRELLDERGKAITEPSRPHVDDIVLEEDYTEWMNRG